jgi:hypothetical protein
MPGARDDLWYGFHRETGALAFDNDALLSVREVALGCEGAG